MKPLQTLTIPKYLKRVKLSNKRRKQYYRLKPSGKWYPRELPTSYQQKIDEGVWHLDKNGYVIQENGEKRLANPKAAGTPKYEALSGNSFMAGFNSYHIRNTLVTKLKDFYTPYVTQQLTAFQSSELPIGITWGFYTTIGEANWDMDNMAFYWKYLQDTLVQEGIIPDDTIQYITAPPAGVFTPVDTLEERKFVFRFYKDARSELLTFYQKKELLLTI